MYSSNKSPHLEAPLLPFQRPRRHVSYHGPQARLLLLSEAAVHCLVSSLTFCPSLLLPDPSYSGEWRHLLEKLVVAPGISSQELRYLATAVLGCEKGVRDIIPSVHSVSRLSSDRQRAPLKFGEIRPRRRRLPREIRGFRGCAWRGTTDRGRGRECQEVDPGVYLRTSD